MVIQTGKGTKRLVIEFDFHTPRFTFEGDWSGRDVITARNLLRREYLKFVRSIRRQAMSTSEGGPS